MVVGLADGVFIFTLSRVNHGPNQDGVPVGSDRRAGGLEHPGIRCRTVAHSEKGARRLAVRKGWPRPCKAECQGAVTVRSPAALGWTPRGWFAPLRHLQDGYQAVVFANRAPKTLTGSPGERSRADITQVRTNGSALRHADAQVGSSGSPPAGDASSRPIDIA